MFFSRNQKDCPPSLLVAVPVALEQALPLLVGVVERYLAAQRPRPLADVVELVEKTFVALDLPSFPFPWIVVEALWAARMAEGVVAWKLVEWVHQFPSLFAVLAFPYSFAVVEAFDFVVASFPCPFEAAGAFVAVEAHGFDIAAVAFVSPAD